MRHPQLAEILAQFRAALQDLYRDRLVQVILYGSQVRGDATPQSDIDVAIVLRGSFDYSDELQRTSPMTGDICLEYGILLSRIVIEESRLQDVSGTFIKNLKSEGMLV